jgi:hypothetical protein
MYNVTKKIFRKVYVLCLPLLFRNFIIYNENNIMKGSQVVTCNILGFHSGEDRHCHMYE